MLVKVADEPGIYVEAITTSEASQKEIGQIARTNQVYDILNEMDSPDFFIGLKLFGAPKTPPPAKQIRKQVSQWLKTLDPDVITEIRQHDTNKALPKLEIHYDGWRIVFLPLPKSRATRGKPGVRPIGMQVKGLKTIKTKQAIRKAVAKKSTRYGEIDGPYIIAVNILSPFLDRDEVMDALFGSAQYAFWTDMPDDHPPEMTRTPDGAWLGPSGPQNTRVSAVLIAQQLTPWSIASNDLTLYHHPWAQRRISSGPITTVSQAIPNNNQMLQKAGIHPRNIFGLELGWPEF